MAGSGPAPVRVKWMALPIVDRTEERCDTRGLWLSQSELRSMSTMQVSCQKSHTCNGSSTARRTAGPLPEATFRSTLSNCVAVSMEDFVGTDCTRIVLTSECPMKPRRGHLWSHVGTPWKVSTSTSGCLARMAAASCPIGNTKRTRAPLST